MAAPTLLVVEDELVVAEDLRMTLSGMGYNVPGVAGDSDEAIALAGEIRPDIVLMDIVLEGSELDGIGTAEKIRAMYGIPAIFITAYSDNATIDRAKHVGPFGYILKPFNIREVRSAIEIALYKHRVEQEIQKRDAILFGISFAIEWFLRTNETHGRNGQVGERMPGYGIPDILEHLGLAIEATHIAVFTFGTGEPGSPALAMRFVWHAQGNSPAVIPETGLPVGEGKTEIPPLREKLMRGETLAASDETPGGPERELLKILGGTSLAVVPVFRNDCLWGCIGFSDDTNRCWSAEETEALRIAGNLIGAVLGGEEPR
ncbi:MAG: response regulator [Methanoregulaceae archaeon]